MKAKQAAPVSTHEYAAVFLIFLYVLVDFVPRYSAVDIIGPQWLYIGIVNVIAVFYLLSRRSHATGNNNQPANTWNAAVVSYLLFFLFVTLSFFVALNKIEFLTCYARLLITVIAFFNLVFLLGSSSRLFLLLSQVIAFIALVKCIQSLGIFFTDIPDVGLREAILNMKGDAGNKNIFASSVVVKIPFIIYCIYKGKLERRFINMIILSIVFYTLFIANSRSSYIGLLVEILIFAAFCIYNWMQERKVKTFLVQAGTVLLPLIISIVFSQVTINSVRNPDDGPQVYGTISERIQGIGFSNSGSSNRFIIWEGAGQIIKSHPLTGVGYGNWKIYSIPYEQWLSDYIINLHAHNDFLEIFGETGLLGGLCYLLVFVFLFVRSIRSLFSKRSTPEQKAIILVSLMLLGGYVIDALLNFPQERTSMQVYFVLLFSINIVYAPESVKRRMPATRQQKIFSLQRILALFLSVPALYISYQVYESMVVQADTFTDISAEHPVNSWMEVNDRFPSIPNLTQTGLPIDGIKARYLILGGKYEEARPYMEKAIRANPNIMYGEFLKGISFYNLHQTDSAWVYAKKVFDKRPRSYAHFSLLTNVAIARKDSNYLKQAFNEYVKINPSPEPWSLYLYALTTFNSAPAALKRIADSAYKLYPKDEQVAKNKRAVDDMVAGKKNAFSSAVPVADSTSSVDSKQVLSANAAMQEGLKLYAAKQYRKALEYFKMATQSEPGYYPSVENTGMCYYQLADYATALKYFMKVVQSGLSADGKSEFFAGICLINTGKRTAGCESFKVAASKKYFDAQRLIDLNCK